MVELEGPSEALRPPSGRVRAVAAALLCSLLLSAGGLPSCKPRPASSPADGAAADRPAAAGTASPAVETLQRAKEVGDRLDESFRRQNEAVRDAAGDAPGGGDP